VKSINDSFQRLEDFCVKQQFRGWDPYDGLNSRIFQKLFVRYIAIFRLAWLQLFKNSPLNLRNFLKVEPTLNPKGLALFLSGYVNLIKIRDDDKDKQHIQFLLKHILDSQIKGRSVACWGYNFDWQSRAFYFPNNTPNVVVSTFVGNALLDAYELSGDAHLLKVARSICDFILKDLNRSFFGGIFCFSYSPLDHSRIYNTSFLASKFLARVYSLTKEELLLSEARKSLQYGVNKQNEDGSWFYGEARNQKWIDGFHTAYNLEAIYDYQLYTNDRSFHHVWIRGLDFYLSNFFTAYGMPKYYHRAVYPWDIHSVASFLVLLSKSHLLKEYHDLVQKVLNWTMTNMQDSTGYFYYQMRRLYKIRIPYMRWSCAWMFYALTCYLKEQKNDIKAEPSLIGGEETV